MATRFVHGFSGDLIVRDGDFTLFADRLIVRHNEIAFELSGHEEYGPYRFTGTAPKGEDGTYLSASLPLVIVGSKERFAAAVQFTKVEPSPKSKHLHVQGKWFEHGDAFDFEGTLVEC